MIRNTLGSVLALVGAAVTVLSPFRPWYDGRLGRHYGIADPFTGITSARADLLGSILLFFLFTALLTVIGVALRSRPLVAVAGVLVLGFTALWMVRLGQVLGSLGVASNGSGLRWGVAGAAAGGGLTLLGAAMMAGRRRGGGRRDGEWRRGGRPPVREEPARPYAAPGPEHPDTWPPTQEPGPSVQTSTLPEPEPDPYTGPDPYGRPGPWPGPDEGPGSTGPKESPEYRGRPDRGPGPTGRDGGPGHPGSGSWEP
ncbi:hypothetical protein ACFYYY_04310 [Streptomyces sp. NPDC001834]|uniref:hypothetical protein n=1 Tax=Streptomyces sp. NPDC001834 TaxID=3364616 RepID=UPI00369FC970